MLELLLGLAPILLAATALLATPFGLPVLSWFIGNPVSRVVAIIGIVIMSLWLAFQLGRKDGVQRIRAQETARNLDALRERIAVDESIRAMTPEQRREELRKWIR